MFRVLTERKNKKYGYYVDFSPDRAITFLYQFNEVYELAKNGIAKIIEIQKKTLA